MNLHQLSVEIAENEIGVKENFVNGHYNNRGTKVDEYQRADTLPGEGYAWCDSFAGCWVPLKVGLKAGIKIPGVYSASVDRTWADARTRKLIRTKPQPGFLFVVRAKISNGFSTYDGIHIGIVRKVIGDKFTTIEGNTNGGGGREGYGVLSHTRDIEGRYAFFDLYAGLQVPVAPPKPQPITTWEVTLDNGKEIKRQKVQSFDSRPVMPVREFGDFFNAPVIWTPKNNAVTMNGQEIPEQVRIFDGVSYYPARVLGDQIGARVDADWQNKKVSITKGTKR